MRYRLIALGCIFSIVLNTAVAEQPLSTIAKGQVFIGGIDERANLSFTVVTSNLLYHARLSTNVLHEAPAELDLHATLSRSNLKYAVRSSIEPNAHWQQFDPLCGCWHELPRPMPVVTNVDGRLKITNRLTRHYSTLKRRLQAAVVKEDFAAVAEHSEDLKRWLPFIGGETNRVSWSEPDGERSLEANNGGILLLGPNGSWSKIASINVIVKGEMNPCAINGLPYGPVIHAFAGGAGFTPGLRHPGFDCEVKEGVLRVGLVYRESDAFQKGLRPGHQILALNGSAIKNPTYEAFVEEVSSNPTLKILTDDPQLGAFTIAIPKVETYYEKAADEIIIHTYQTQKK